MPQTLIGPAQIPSLGFGTFRMEGETARKMTAAALDAGFRHIDTAQVYDNEAEVGAGLRDASVPRSSVFLTTKILPESFRKADFIAAAETSLKRLGTDYVDLLLCHWPSREVPIAETMEAMNRLIADGKVRHGGVSNFTIAQVDEARAALETPLAANQVELHPFIDQSKLRAHLDKLGVPIEAYCPLAQGRVAQDALLQEIGAAHGVSAAQVALAWLLSKPLTVALPKTASPERLEGNLAAADLELSAEEVARIDALARPEGRMVSPPALAPDWD